jgi:ATP/maltotriose-dependent transcriptional regulator MalT
LSERERSVLELVAQGLSNRAIGAVLFISEATVKYHLQRIYAKLGVSDRTEAVVQAMRRGLLAAR